MTKLAVIYYSATGHGTTMAQRIADAAAAAGAEVRVRHVAETRDPESFAANPAWTANYEATKDLPAATGDDVVWADAVIFGSPTRFGSAASQLRASSTRSAGCGRRGRLADKVYAGFTSTKTEHGGQETTLLTLYVTMMHFGGIVVPPGYADAVKFVDGNPYGVGTAPPTTWPTRRRDERRARSPRPSGGGRFRSAHVLRPDLLALADGCLE